MRQETHRLRPPRWPSGLVPWRSAVQSFLEKLSTAAKVQIEVQGATRSQSGEELMLDLGTTPSGTATAQTPAQEAPSWPSGLVPWKMAVQAHAEKLAAAAGVQIEVFGTTRGQSGEQPTLEVGNEFTPPSTRSTASKKDASVPRWPTSHVGWCRALQSFIERLASALQTSLELGGVARSSGGDKSFQQPILAALNKIDFKSLMGLDRVTLIRDYMLTFTRLGEPDAATKAELIAKLNPLFPTNDTGLNRDLAELLVYLGDAGIVAKAAPLVNDSPTQEEQIDYARILRFAKTGWTKELRTDYFRWFLRAANYKGGASFDLFIGEIKQDALKTMTEEEKIAIKDVLDAKPDNFVKTADGILPFDLLMLNLREDG